MHITITLLKLIYNYYSDFLGSLRASYWRMFCAELGKETRIYSGTNIMSPENVNIGRGVFINRNTSISATGGQISIGNFCMIANNCNLIATNHGYANHKKPMFIQPIFGGPINIQEDVWIGANVVICPNVTIGRGAIVGANSVVTSNIEPFSIVGGVPARHIKYRFDEKLRNEATKIDFERYTYNRRKGLMHAI